MKKINFILLCLFSVLLIRCASSKINSGIIVDKLHQPPEENRIFFFMPLGPILLPMTNTRYDDEDYILVVSGETEKGKRCHKSCFTTPAIFNLYQICDNIEFPADSVYFNDDHITLRSK